MSGLDHKQQYLALIDIVRVRARAYFAAFHDRRHASVAVGLVAEGGKISRLRAGLTGTNAAPLVVDIPAADTDTAATALEAAVQKAVSPARTTLIQPQYRRRAVAALAG